MIVIMTMTVSPARAISELTEGGWYGVFHGAAQSGPGAGNLDLISYDGPGGEVTVPAANAQYSTLLGKNLFQGRSDINKVTLPKNLTSIGENAFEGCSALSEVYFLGSQTQWNAISIGSGNDPLNKAQLRFAIIASGECGAQGDNLTWTLDSDGVLTIIGSGDMKSYNGYM